MPSCATFLLQPNPDPTAHRASSCPSLPPISPLRLTNLSDANLQKYASAPRGCTITLRAQEELIMRLKHRGKLRASAELLALTRVGLRNRTKWSSLGREEARLRARLGDVSQARRILRRIWDRLGRGSAKGSYRTSFTQHIALRDLFSLAKHPGPDLLPPLHEQAHHIATLARTGQSSLYKEHLRWLQDAQWISANESIMLQPHLKSLVRPRRKRNPNTIPPTLQTPMGQSIARELVQERALVFAATNQLSTGLAALNQAHDSTLHTSTVHPERTLEHSLLALHSQSSALLALDTLHILTSPASTQLQTDALWFLALDQMKRQNIQKARLYLELSYEYAHGFAAESKRAPDTHPQARALYWIARIYESTHNPIKAHALFERVAQHYPLTSYHVLSIDGLRRLQPHTTTQHTPTLPPILHPIERALYSFKSPSVHGPLQDLLSYQRAAPHHMQLLASHTPMSLVHLWTLHTFSPLQTRHGWFVDESPSPVTPKISKEWWDYIRTDAKRNRIDPLWIFALIHTESNFKPKVCSASKACGLMQLKVSAAQTAARSIGLKPPTIKELDNPFLNITLGTKLLAHLEAKTGDPIRALAAYNAGPGAVRRWNQSLGLTHMPGDLFLEMIPSPRTRAYVLAIITRYGHHTVHQKRNQTRALLSSNASLIHNQTTTPHIP